MGQLAYNFSFVKEANQYLDGLSYMSGWCLAASKEIWQKLIIPKNTCPLHIINLEPFSQNFQRFHLRFVTYSRHFITSPKEIYLLFKVLVIRIKHPERWGRREEVGGRKTLSLEMKIRLSPNPST